jgi:hypothetical protein
VPGLRASASAAEPVSARPIRPPEQQRGGRVTRPGRRPMLAGRTGRLAAPVPAP